jgi:arsenate reductase (glutaredoxin)
MKKIYYLSSCDDCRRVIKHFEGMHDFEKQEIKSEPIMPAQLKTIRDLAGSYDAVFSRKAVQYRLMNLKEKQLSETAIRDLILAEYTFLKRPVIIIGSTIFIGHQAETITAIEKLLKS